MAKDNEVALEGTRQGIVLLKNDGALPLSPDSTAHIVITGGHAEEGVITGTGSSAVVPPGGYKSVIRIGGPGIMGGGRNMYLFPSSPLAELKKLLPKAKFDFEPE